MNLEETNDKNELDEELWCSFRNKISNNTINKSNNRSNQNFNFNFVFSCLILATSGVAFSTSSTLPYCLCKKNKLIISVHDLSFHIFPSFWSAIGEAEMVQWWECSPPTNVARVQFPDPASYVGWVCCWFSTLLWEVFLWVRQVFPSPQNTNISKFQFDPGMRGHILNQFLRTPGCSVGKQVTFLHFCNFCCL